MFGSHLSIAGGMVNALHEAQPLGLDTVQVFTKNQQQWSVPSLDEQAALAWCERLDALGWRGRTVSHASYLINLASGDDELWAKSLALMHEEIERCERLGIAFLVFHPGSYVRSDLASGMARISKACAELLARTRGYATTLCLEGTAGAGSHIGGRFEHLAALRDGIEKAGGDVSRVGFCLDTCHMHAAGYDLRTRAAAAMAIEQFDTVCGLAHVRVLHVNDSKGACGTHLDRHEHIGEGTIGGGRIKHADTGVFDQGKLDASGFWTFMNHPAFAAIPKIMETPKDPRKGEPNPEEPFDAVNLRRLKSLIESSPEGKRAGKPAHRARTARSGS
ncbi:MAG: deoxyribonuclease IV [Phycisphaerales bacterium]|nr:deoxyribonuclease IV [Phycisphaerales bacterium]